MAHLGYQASQAVDDRFLLISMNTFEPMSAEIVHRPKGTPYWLFVFFYDEAEVRFEHGQFRCPANSLVIWPPQQAHYLGNQLKRWRHAWFFAQGTALESILVQQQIETLRVLPLSNHHETDAFFQDLYRENSEYQTVDIQIIIQLLDTWMRRVRRDLDAPRLHNNRLNKLKRFIENNLDQELNLKRLADEAGLSISHLSSEFKQEFNCSPIDYVIKRRLDQARYLLTNHNLHIKQIASRVGYNDEFHFSRIFKKHYGLSPRALRQQGQILA